MGGQSEFTDRTPFVGDIKAEGNKNQHEKIKLTQQTHINVGIIS